VTRDLVVTVGYVGNRGLKALVLHWLNDINPVTGLRPVSTTSRVSYQEHAGQSNYHGLQLSVKKRFQPRLYVQPALHLRQVDRTGRHR